MRQGPGVNENVPSEGGSCAGILRPPYQMPTRPVSEPRFHHFYSFHQFLAYLTVRVPQASHVLPWPAERSRCLPADGVNGRLCLSSCLSQQQPEGTPSAVSHTVTLSRWLWQQPRSAVGEKPGWLALAERTACGDLPGPPVSWQAELWELFPLGQRVERQEGNE